MKPKSIRLSETEEKMLSFIQEQYQSKLGHISKITESDALRLAIREAADKLGFQESTIN